jgi:hypothetical protein
MSNTNNGTDRPWYFSGDLKIFAIKTCLVAIVTIFAHCVYRKLDSA